jgi:GntR family transcriptional regulator
VNDKDSPAYLRLRGEIVGSILDGRYRDGDALPSVRSLAAEHGLNPLTVAKAYQTFQEDGLVNVRRGIGMFVAEGASDRLRRSERKAFLTEHWPPIARRIRALGLDVDDLLEHERG